MKKAEIQKRLAKLLRAHPEHDHISRVSLFGSQLHGTAKTGSDIDLLIEFNEPISMFTLVRMERDMSKALGIHVDLSTPNSLSKYFRSDVIETAEPIFEQ